MRLRAVLASAALASAVVASYIKWIRPRTMHWGATEEEAARRLPFDDVFPNAPWNATRAVTIEATPQQIWPWLVQIGWGRAGWYGYDWADNGGKPSVWQILPEYQHLEIGKDFPMSPWTAVYCKGFEEPRWMLWRTSETAGTWLWYLDPIDSQHTRLITRMRGLYHWTNPILLPQEIAVDLFDIIFMRKCMLGIKARAEAMARGQVPTL
jgi:hypothetical protein